MPEHYKPGHFKVYREKLKDGAKLAIDRATSQGEIRRIMELVRFKEQAIKKTEAMYFQIKKTKGINKKVLYEIINVSLDEIMKADSLGSMRRISNLRDAKVRALKL